MSNIGFYDIQYKANAGQVNLDQAQGIVECFVAGIGNKDSVGDVCASGAFTKSLLRRKPRVVWGHNWNDPIGKVLEIYEVPPNDPRLPGKMKSAGIGGLYARVQFNLNSEKGREAFANVAFFGEEQEWSIGYKTIKAQFDQQNQANILYEVELYEVSPVLHGANQLTGTISVKDAEKGGTAVIPMPTNPMDMPEEDIQRKLQDQLSAQLGGKVKVSAISDGHVMFSREGDEGNMYKCRFHHEDGAFMFGQPQRIVMPMPQAPKPQQMPQMPMGMPSKPIQPAQTGQTVVVPAALPGGNPQQQPLVRISYTGEDSNEKPAGKPKLVQEEADLANALLQVVKRHGKFNEDSTGVWAGYKKAEENPVAKIGVKCSNCVMYEGEGNCKIIAMDVDPGGKCRFAIIPEGVVSTTPIKKQEVNAEKEQEEVKWLTDIEAKFPEEFLNGELRMALKRKREASTESVKMAHISEFESKSIDSNTYFYVPVDPEHAFEMKQAIDPIIDYYRADAYVEDGGIVFTSGVNKDFAEAIDTAVKALGRNLAGKLRGGGRGMSARFNPNAWDGDNDGIVQEGTPFQRPAIPGVNDFSTRGKVNKRKARQAWDQYQREGKPKVQKRTASQAPRPSAAAKPVRGEDMPSTAPRPGASSASKRSLTRHSNRDAKYEAQFPDRNENAKRESHEALIQAWEQGMGMPFTPIERQVGEKGPRFSEDWLRGRELGYNDAKARWMGKGTSKRPSTFKDNQKSSVDYANWFMNVVGQLGRDKRDRDNRDPQRGYQNEGIEAGIKTFLMENTPTPQSRELQDAIANTMKDAGFERGRGLSSGRKINRHSDRDADIERQFPNAEENAKREAHEKFISDWETGMDMSFTTIERQRDEVGGRFSPDFLRAREVGYNDARARWFGKGTAEQPKNFDPKAKASGKYSSWYRDVVSQLGRNKANRSQDPSREQEYAGEDAGMKDFLMSVAPDTSNWAEEDRASLAKLEKDYGFGRGGLSSGKKPTGEDDSTSSLSPQERADLEARRDNEEQSARDMDRGLSSGGNVAPYEEEYRDLPEEMKEYADAVQEAIDSGVIDDESSWGDWAFNNAKDIAGEQAILEAMDGSTPTDSELREYADSVDWGLEGSGPYGSERDRVPSWDEVRDAYIEASLEDASAGDYLAAITNEYTTSEFREFLKYYGEGNWGYNSRKFSDLTEQEKNDLLEKAKKELAGYGYSREFTHTDGVIDLDKYYGRRNRDGKVGLFGTEDGKFDLEKWFNAREYEYHPDLKNGWDKVKGGYRTDEEKRRADTKNRSGLSSGKLFIGTERELEGARRKKARTLDESELEQGGEFVTEGYPLNYRGTGIGTNDPQDLEEITYSDAGENSVASPKKFVGNTVAFADGRRGVITSSLREPDAQYEEDYDEDEGYGSRVSFTAGEAEIMITHDKDGKLLDTPERFVGTFSMTEENSVQTSDYLDPDYPNNFAIEDNKVSEDTINDLKSVGGSRRGLSSGRRSDERGIDYRQGDPETVGRDMERLSQRSDDLGANFRHLLRNVPEGDSVVFEYRGKLRQVTPEWAGRGSASMKTSSDGAVYFGGIDSETGEFRTFRLDRINGLIQGADYVGYNSGWDGSGFNDELPRALTGLGSGRRGMSSGRYGEQYDPSKRDPSDYAQLNGKPHRPRWDGKSGQWVYDTPDDGTSKTRPHNWDTPDTPAEDHDMFWRDYVRIPYQELLAEYPIVAGEKSPAISGRVQRLAAARRFRMGLPFDGKLKPKRIRQFGQMSEDETEYQKQLVAEAIAKDFSHSGLSVDELAYRFTATPLQIHDVLDSVAELAPETFDGDRRATDIPSPSREVQRLRRERIELAQEYDTALKTNKDIISRRSDLIAEHPSTKRMKNIQALRLAKQNLRLAGVSFETADKDLEALRSEDNKIVNAKLKEIYDVDDEDLASTAREIFEENLSEDFDEDGEYIGPEGAFYDAEDAKQGLIKDWDLINVLVESGQAKDDKDAENILSGLVFNDVATLVPDQDVIRLLAFNQAREIELELNRYKEVSSRLKANDPALNASEKENINEIFELEAEATNAVNAVLQDVDVPEKPRTPSSARGLSSGRSRSDSDGVDVGTVAGTIYNSTATRGMSSGATKIDRDNPRSIVSAVSKAINGEKSKISYRDINDMATYMSGEEISRGELGKLARAYEARRSILEAFGVQDTTDIEDADERVLDALDELDSFISGREDAFFDADTNLSNLRDEEETLRDSIGELEQELRNLTREEMLTDIEDFDSEGEYQSALSEIENRKAEISEELTGLNMRFQSNEEAMSLESILGEAYAESKKLKDEDRNLRRGAPSGVTPRERRRTELSSGRRDLTDDDIEARNEFMREGMLDQVQREEDDFARAFAGESSLDRAKIAVAYRRETGRSANPKDSRFRQFAEEMLDAKRRSDEDRFDTARDQARGLSSGSRNSESVERVAGRMFDDYFGGGSDLENASPDELADRYGVSPSVATRAKREAQEFLDQVDRDMEDWVRNRPEPTDEELQAQADDYFRRYPQDGLSSGRNRKKG